MPSAVKTTKATGPRHVAIIMDGNGRWAKRRFMPRHAGHRAGVKAVRRTVEAAADHGVEVLTLFAFSSENWNRPVEEVSLLMELFLSTLQREIDAMHENGIRLHFIGDLSGLNERLLKQIDDAKALTVNNTKMQLLIAVGYGGRWDITNAARTLAERVQQGQLEPGQITEQLLGSHLATASLPEPDLFIRTGGEVRVSNFLLWQLAYTEFYFLDMLWPEFDQQAFGQAVSWYSGRQRRFGLTGEQVTTPDPEAIKTTTQPLGTKL